MTPAGVASARFVLFQRRHSAFEAAAPNLATFNDTTRVSDRISRCGRD
jgi:hypothetical protein